MSTSIPYIPDNAPFTEEQRAWLNGMLAGMFSSATQSAPAEAKASQRIAVLYASQSGTAEGLARKLAKELKAQGHFPAVSTLVAYTPAALAAEEYAVLVASTYGEGEAPDGVQPFYEALCLEHFPRFDKLRYSVLALGDRHYEQFCKFGIDLDTKLAALGANRICDRVECDVDVDEPFSRWKTSVLTKLKEQRHSQKVNTAALTVPPVITNPVPVSAFTRDNPMFAPLVEKKLLNQSASSKVTLHVAFSIAEAQFTYEAGDACGVIPSNDLNLVAEIMQRAGFNGNEKVNWGKNGATTLHDALSRHLQITRLSRKIVSEYAKRGRCAKLLDLLSPDHQAQLESYVYDRGLIDLLVEYPGVVEDASDLVSMLPRLTPRLYSISSSPAAHAGEIHTAVAVVRYRSHERERGGVCSTLFADRVTVSDRLPIYIQPNKKFRLPADPDASVIMIGPGTGVAPFRGFLHERRAKGAKGRNWLFFGERSAATDYLYRDELESMHGDGHLTRLDTAFSRDQERKLYVQDRMLERAQDFWAWLEDGASVYVCGDASRMAKDVHVALHTIVANQGCMSSEGAEDYLQSLKDQHRYHRDVY
jgi:sulfite reductase (NADPH) flavoprotein alpha-component